MAVTNTTAVAFCTREIRGFADAMVELDARISGLQAQWASVGELVDNIPNDSTTIDDGADTDGRPVIVGSDVHNMLNRAAEFRALMDTVGVRNTIYAVASQSS